MAPTGTSPNALARSACARADRIQSASRFVTCAFNTAFIISVWLAIHNTEKFDLRRKIALCTCKLLPNRCYRPARALSVIIRLRAAACAAYDGAFPREDGTKQARRAFLYCQASRACIRRPVLGLSRKQIIHCCVSRFAKPRDFTRLYC